MWAFGRRWPEVWCDALGVVPAEGDRNTLDAHAKHDLPSQF